MDIEWCLACDSKIPSSSDSIPSASAFCSTSCRLTAQAAARSRSTSPVLLPAGRGGTVGQSVVWGGEGRGPMVGWGNGFEWGGSGEDDKDGSEDYIRAWTGKGKGRQGFRWDAADFEEASAPSLSTLDTSTPSIDVDAPKSSSSLPASASPPPGSPPSFFSSCDARKDAEGLRHASSNTLRSPPYFSTFAVPIARARLEGGVLDRSFSPVSATSPPVVSSMSSSSPGQRVHGATRLMSSDRLARFLSDIGRILPTPPETLRELRSRWEAEEGMQEAGKQGQGAEEEGEDADIDDVAEALYAWGGIISSQARSRKARHPCQGEDASAGGSAGRLTGMGPRRSRPSELEHGECFTANASSLGVPLLSPQRQSTSDPAANVNVRRPRRRSGGYTPVRVPLASWDTIGVERRRTRLTRQRGDYSPDPFLLLDDCEKQAREGGRTAEVELERGRSMIRTGNGSSSCSGSSRGSGSRRCGSRHRVRVVKREVGLRR